MLWVSASRFEEGTISLDNPLPEEENARVFNSKVERLSDDDDDSKTTNGHAKIIELPTSLFRP